MLFSAGIPLLYPITAAYCAVTYWVDKYLLTKFYKKPPNYNTRVARGTLRSAKWAILLHFLCGVYQYRNSAILATSPFMVEEAVTQEAARASPAAGAYGALFALYFGAWLLWRYALRYAVAACRGACGRGAGGLRASEIHQDFYQKCSFSTLVAMWKVTNEASERMAERALFDEASGFVGQSDIDLYLTKSLYPRGAALEKRFRALALGAIDDLNKLQGED